MFIHRGLAKKGFFEKNQELIQDDIDLANAHLDDQYDGNALDVTIYDFAILLNAEAGLSGGKVDPHHRHSEGERGLFPLPRNIRYWNGSGAPAWNEPMPLEVNIRAFITYIGQLKNKNVAQRNGYMLYSGLFDDLAIDADPIVQAKVVAGVVHGYFSRGRYGGQAVPITEILDGYKAGLPLTDIMRDRSYVNSAPNRFYIIEGRHANIEEALTWI